MLRSIKKNVTLKVILDSNFLFIPLQFRIDIFEEIRNLLNQNFELIVLSTTRRELQKMAEQGSPKLRKQAAMALKLTEKCHIIDVEKSLEETNDEVIVRVAALWRSPVATNDGELRRKLRSRDIPVVFLRGKSRLELDGVL
jgi:rRNA-processing protein FCF1